jgi:hypothetical protein
VIYPLQSDLKPVITGVIFDALLKDVKAQEIEYRRCQAEPWYWLVNYVWTKRKDENVESSEVERFPADEYLRFTFDMCFREKHLAIDKSRQMRMTWLMMAYGLYWAQFHDNEEVICQTKKEDIADSELVKRALFMFERQPIWMRQTVASSFNKLGFQNGSVIRGIPSGGDQIRSYNPTRYLGDECGFLEGEFDECKSAALACCKDVKLFSSAQAGEWEQFINDVAA